MVGGRSSAENQTTVVASDAVADLCPLRDEPVGVSVGLLPVRDNEATYELVEPVQR